MAFDAKLPEPVPVIIAMNSKHCGDETRLHYPVRDAELMGSVIKDLPVGVFELPSALSAAKGAGPSLRSHHPTVDRLLAGPIAGNKDPEKKFARHIEPPPKDNKRA